MKNKKKTQEYIDKFFESKGYKVKEKYINSSTPIVIENKEGYYSCITYSNLYCGKKPTYFGLNNKFLEHNIKLLISKKNNKVGYMNYKVIQKGKRKRVLVTIRCSCGSIFRKTLDDINRKDHNLCCNECSKRIRGKKKRKSKFEMFNFIESLGYKIIDKKKDYLRNEFIEVYNKEGYRGFIKYNSLRQGKQMSIFNEHMNLSNYVYNANIYAKQNNINCEIISLSKCNKWNRQGLKIKCECGKIFETSLPSFQNGKIRCDDCSKNISIFAFAIKQYLDDNNIKYIREFRFNSCRDVLPLPFDFFLKDLNKLIEVDGQGHYKAIECWNGQKGLELTQKHDKIKNDFCKKNNIPLLRISYKDIENKEYESMIKQFIEK